MMINVIKYPAKKDWEEIIKRPAFETASLEKAVKKILERVKIKGDKAIRNYTKEFDGVKLKKLQVSEKEIKAAAKLLPVELKEAIQQAKLNIEKFHRSQVDAVKMIETMPGINCWRTSLRFSGSSKSSFASDGRKNLTVPETFCPSQDVRGNP